ncbi:glycosyltransferase family 4 protein [Methanococcoides sp. SA1]|nr:glycosyltransferase family 4 protein [Methanococcoides sp. SA1]
MNILFYASLKPGVKGNYPTHVYEVLYNLSKLGHNVISIDMANCEYEQKYDSKQRLSLCNRLKSNLATSRILHPFMGEILIFVALLREISIFISACDIIIKKKVKVDVIYRRHSYFRSDYFLAKIFKIPLVEEVNGINAEGMKVTKRGNIISLWIIDRVERFNMPKADKIIVVTAKLKDVLCNEYHVSEDKIIVIENGANTDLFKSMDGMKARSILGLDECTKYICFVGSLVQWQGVEHIIRSTPLVLKVYSNIRFLIVGDGPMKEELMELAEQVGVSDKFIFTGSDSYERMPLYINASEVCLTPKMPLKTGYSPQKLYEYMACEKPTIATKTDGFEILEEHNAGLLINPENYKELASATIKLLEDESLRIEMGKNGREFVVKNHSWEAVAKNVADVFEEAVTEHKKSRNR